VLESDLRARAEREAADFERHVAEAVRTSRNERELQTQVNARLTAFAASVGAEVVLREEYTVVAGRADAVFNRLIIEYEAPASLRLDLGHGRTAHAVKQARDYIEGVSKRDHFAKDRLLGVAFDGTVVIFVRFREGNWVVDPPLSWNRATASRLLRAVVALSAGRALTPENLVEDFGAQSPISQRATRALYASVPGRPGSMTDAMYRQWGVFFSEVSGYSEADSPLAGKPELQSFATGMGLDPKTTDPPRLLFAIHTYFSFLAKTIARLVLERYSGGGLGTSPLTVVATLDGEPLRRELLRLEEGGIFKTLGFTNLLKATSSAGTWIPGHLRSPRYFIRRLNDWLITTPQRLRKILSRRETCSRSFITNSSPGTFATTSVSTTRPTGSPRESSGSWENPCTFCPLRTVPRVSTSQSGCLIPPAAPGPF